MSYNAIIEGINNGIKQKRYLEGYKTVSTLNRAITNYLEKNKVVCLGYCKYTFNGIEEQKYKYSAYKIIDRYNCKAFFEYWT